MTNPPVGCMIYSVDIQYCYIEGYNILFPGIRTAEQEDRMDSFSKRLAKALQARQMPQSVLASKIGVSRALITMYVKGRTAPRKSRLSEISKALDVQTAWLLGYNVSMGHADQSDEVADKIRIMFGTLPPADQKSLLDTLNHMDR